MGEFGGCFLLGLVMLALGRLFNASLPRPGPISVNRRRGLQRRTLGDG
ncbi:hypothetical protein THL1_418 [Pseudomonas sp. TCU-HL1]|nr:hypothetical protein THL1_418 [Pseudomonas sp. TCU-HL1]